ncbi:ATP phosphoribosyltransferase regulatory subunit [Heyndrickxia sporothermodurans]|uniref:ATP phosphoribosyltransferase regulatory subunit n=1 Tax=Heyndrickxia TaxID=2837504 RepID=UPI000D3C07FE|nr:ATP phosphoribosyltransferase regulatory subunit [Heyndrickxia sporothermodurans]MEB6550305.1 ATP phosphoribosyltransferase regulatory subunit [Heyndrickxia sporothermodurans]MED3655902.1 ATP phosphoribosyltransferase regulatory subunit [Heyndrickxia sporothermodurans]PTY78831.1 ATP phosphoribosyltransferase regulatory subunit [Heyndrickxia sporothermodurans]
MLLPIGSQDDFGKTVANRNFVFEAFRKVTTLRGYEEISTPVVEYASIFTNKHVGMSLQSLMKWFNSEGEIVVLRPDWTTAIARALTKHSKSPEKWAYQGSIFKNNKLGVESRQVGIEIINFPNFQGESECLLLTKDFLDELTINHYIIELGHTGIFEFLINQLDLNDGEIETLQLAMHDKRKDKVYELAARNGKEHIASELVVLIDAFGPFDEVLNEYEIRWKNRPALLKIVKHIKKLAKLLNESGKIHVIVDLGMVKKLPYYSGIIFRGFLEGNGSTCFSGGRYDKLYDQFGENKNAVGLAFDVDILAEQLRIDKIPKRVCIIASDETLSYAEKIRKNYENFIVEVFYDDGMINKDDFHKVLYILQKDGTYEVVEK